MFGFGGIPGGSPGSDAQGSWKGLIFVTVFSLALGGGLLYVWREAFRAIGP